ncbi:MAG: hypothetical protein DMF63_06025 [Acidobacteria bacterium]|nr:MAG: hypothetical protein DMF63_06025 [Acidobacteriota bacterium]
MSQPQPSNLNVQVGSNVTLSVGATGNELMYQWRKNGQPIVGNPTATTATLQLTNVQVSDSGVYDVVVSNSGGSETSDPVNLTVTSGPVDPAPTITDQPDDTMVSVGSSATLSVTATGSNLVYQWYKDGMPIPGATGPTLTFPMAQLSDTGDYYVVVSNSGGTVTSNTAHLTVVSTISLIDVAPPTGTTNVCTDTAIRITFDQPPVAGTSGTIRIFRADGTLVDTIDMSNDTVPGTLVPGTQSSKSIGGASSMFNYYPILIDGNSATIYLHHALDYNQTYYVMIDAGAITDASGAPFAGINQPNQYQFSTRTAAPAAGKNPLVVSATGAGDFCTVQGAIDFVPTNNTQRRTIYVRNGVYNEIVYVRSNKRFITVRGETRNGARIEYANNENLNTGTLTRTLFGVDAADFQLWNITIRNTTTKLNSANNTRQAEAFRGNNDRIVLNRVSLYSFQDTLLLQSQGPQGAYVNESYIEGDVDFTWGAGTVFFKNCELKDVAPASRPQSYYSQIRNPQGKIGNVYVGCRLTRGTDTPDNSAYLSRIDPDDFPYSQVVWIDTLMDRHITPQGWLINNPSLEPVPANYPNIKFWEYNSRDITTGQPIDVSQRHPLSRQLTPEEAAFWRNPANVLGGWVPNLQGTKFDFDGDGAADRSVFRPGDQTWYLDQTSLSYQITKFGLSSDVIVPADYDGDGRTDIAVYRSGTWYILGSASGLIGTQFGVAGDVPQPADFDGDGRAEVAVFRGGTWYTFNLLNGEITQVQFGLSGDVPVVGDYDGDGKADRAIYRPSTGTWWYLSSVAGTQNAVQFGISSDVPVPADYDGDSKTDFAVYRDGVWWVLNSSSGTATTYQFGISTDQPVPADYDGDGKADFAVYRNGIWYIASSSSGFMITQFGTAGDQPAPGAYIP